MYVKCFQVCKVFSRLR